jgi:hypothetical protein
MKDLPPWPSTGFDYQLASANFGPAYQPVHATTVATVVEQLPLL